MGQRSLAFGARVQVQALRAASKPASGGPASCHHVLWGVHLQLGLQSMSCGLGPPSSTFHSKHAVSEVMQARGRASLHGQSQAGLSKKAQQHGQGQAGIQEEVDRSDRSQEDQRGCLVPTSKPSLICCSGSFASWEQLKCRLPCNV